MQDATGEGSAAAKRGPIPYDRHEAILKKAREDADAPWKPYSDLRELVPADRVGQVSGFLRGIDNDPVSTIAGLVQEALNNPNVSPAMRQRIAALVSAGEPQKAAVEAAKAVEAKPADDPRPKPDMDGGYSDAQLAKLDEWNQRQALAKFKEEFKPVFESHEKAKQAHELETLKAQKSDWANGVFKEVQALPHFKDFQKEIDAEFRKQAPLLGNDPSDAALEALLYKAYAKIVTPNVGKTSNDALLAELKHKAGAGTTSPTGTRKSPVPKSGSFRENFIEDMKTR